MLINFLTKSNNKLLLHTQSTIRSCRHLKRQLRFFATSPTKNKHSYIDTSAYGMLSIDELTQQIQSNKIKNVTVGFTNIYGQLLGKRFHAPFFLKSCLNDGTHACDYLLANDIEQNPTPGYKSINYEKGYGDVHLVVDNDTARLSGHQPNTALVLCDVYDNRTHKIHPLAPRTILRKQIDECSKLGYYALSATELEYYTYKTNYEQANKIQYNQQQMKNVGWHTEDYHLLQTYKEEYITDSFRSALADSGIPVETSKGEAGVGQHELNIEYSDILQMADRHIVYKQILKEVAIDLDISITFMAKPYTNATGSGCHIHLSLYDNSNKNIFKGNKQLGSVSGVSDIFEHFLAGWLKYTPDCMVFYAPTINSYKRYQTSSWAPTRIAWSSDNRTAGYRIVGSGSSLRIENRIPGADINPYLVFAASLASGLQGIKDQLKAPDEFVGNIYEAQSLPRVPYTLQQAVDIFKNSEFAHSSFGGDVVEHYTHFYQTEIDSYNAAVTDWERIRYFERI